MLTMALRNVLVCVLLLQILFEIRAVSLISEPIITPNPIVRRYFSGVEISFTCLFTIDSIIDNDPNKVVYSIWRKGGSLLTEDMRITINAPQKLGGVVYFGSLDFDHLNQLDSANYTCEVFVTSNIANVSANSSIAINVEGPTPEVNLTSSTLRLPTHPDYNQAILICTATLPLPPETDELEFDKVFTWTMSGTDVTSDATTPTDPRGIESVSTLTTDLTIAGDIVIACEVTISVPGDPVVSNSSSFVITVLGPTNPVQSTNLTAVNISYSEAIIQWTVTSIAYTPEQYIVLYGISQSSLTQKSAVVDGAMDLNSINGSYSVVLTGLTHNTVYYYEVRSNNSEGYTDSDTNTFSTEEIFAPDGPPVDLAVTSLNSRTVQFQWSPVIAPLRNGYITSYTIYCNATQVEPVVISAVSSIEMNEGFYSREITGLTPYTVYVCGVYANNTVDAGPNITVQIRTDEDIPESSPEDIRVTPSTSSSVLVTWLLPTSPNGVITKFTLFIDFLNDTTKFLHVSGTIFEYEITSLSPYQMVQVRVSAWTSSGQGPLSDTSSGRSDEGIPGILQDVVYDTISSSHLTVSFANQTMDIARGIILEYEITIELYEGGEIMTIVILANSTEYIAEFNGLRGQVPYTVTVIAINSAGRGEKNKMIVFTEEGRPPPPSNVIATRLNGTHMNVSWDRIPITQSNGFINSYTIIYTRVVTDTKRQSGSVTVSADLNSAVVDGLDSSAEYSISVSGTTAGGIGEESLQVLVPVPAPEDSSGFVLSMMILILIICGGVTLLLVFVIILILVIVIFKSKHNPKKSLQPEIGLKVEPETAFQMAQSPAYGKIFPLSSEEEDGSTFLSALNPTYGSGSDHTYERISTVLTSHSFSQYDCPKPQLPAPRPTNKTLL